MIVLKQLVFPGGAYTGLKRYDDAIEAHRQALRINPEFTEAWFSLALDYSLPGNKTSALDAIRKLRRLDPARADKLFNTIVPR